METHPKLLSSFLDSEAGCCLESSDCMLSGAWFTTVLVRGEFSTDWDSLRVVKKNKEQKHEKLFELEFTGMLGLYINIPKSHSNRTIPNFEKVTNEKRKFSPVAFKEILRKFKSSLMQMCTQRHFV